MTVYFETPITMIDHAIVKSIVDEKRRRLNIQVKKNVLPDGYYMVLKNTLHGRKVSIFSPRDKSRGVEVRLLRVPPLNAKNLGARVIVDKLVPLVDSAAIRSMAEEMRNYLYGGEIILKPGKIEAVEHRDELTEDNVLVTRIVRVETVNAEESRVNLHLEGGEVVRDLRCTITLLEERVNKEDIPFFYAQNIAGDNRVISAQFLNWKFEFAV